MEQNLFQEIQNKRIQIKEFSKKALENEWIDEKSYQSIVKKIDNDTLAIGVIGQMKCGKSTFLNAFLFEDEVLPAATTPMTAALSMITYGEEKKIKAEFYTQKEWEEMRLVADRDINEAEGDKALESKIKAAKELVEKSSKIEKELSTLLGNSKEDEFENLIEYVGADGKYVAVTKSVTIYYPKEWLKGVEIVDTPGFNDPVVSREERTQEFLKKADVVLMLLYAGRAFDATDRDIIFEKVRNVGVGKVLIGVNKYDLCYMQGETPEEIKENVKQEIRKACREYRNSSISELLKDVEPVLFSAGMALMAKMPIDKIQNNENLSFHWKKICDEFEISTQNQMLKDSLVKNLEDAIKEMLESSKEEILFKKPVNMILQSGENINSKIEGDFNDRKILIDTLSKPDVELAEKIRELSKASRKINRKIDNTVLDLESEYDDEVKKIKRKLEDLIDNTKKELRSIIDTEKKSRIETRLKDRVEVFKERDLPRLIEDSERKLQKSFSQKAEYLGEDIEEILYKYVEEPKDLIENFNNEIKRIRVESSSFSEVETNKEDDASMMDYIIGGGLGLATCFAMGIPGLLLISALGNYVSRDDYHKKLDKEFSKIDIQPVIAKLQENKSKYIEKFQAGALSNILESILKDLESVQGKQAEKEKKIASLKAEIEELDSKKGIISSQLSEMKQLKLEILYR
ncbi:dynamin family protein [Weeksellaceae bacterium TAE3-ERU29]|nr:dynamin family protein [Weeksellaceae bacterium TAE3-ERU29]